MCACLLYCLPPCLAISTDATAAVAASAGTFFLLPPGMAGSGKTTLIQRVNSHMHQQKLNGYIINLDPAVSHLPYGANIDIRDTVSSLLQFRLRTSAAVQLPQRFLSKQYCIEQLLRLRQLRWQLRWPIVAEEMQKLCRTQDHVAAVSEQQQHGVGSWLDAAVSCVAYTRSCTCRRVHLGQINTCHMLQALLCPLISTCKASIVSGLFTLDCLVISARCLCVCRVRCTAGELQERDEAVRPGAQRRHPHSMQPVRHTL